MIHSMAMQLEGLAIQLGILKCLYNLLGMPEFTVVTDHRSLVGIFKKNMGDIDNPRLFKWEDST